MATVTPEAAATTAHVDTFFPASKLSFEGAGRSTLRELSFDRLMALLDSLDHQANPDRGYGGMRDAAAGHLTKVNAWIDRQAVPYDVRPSGAPDPRQPYQRPSRQSRLFTVAWATPHGVVLGQERCDGRGQPRRPAGGVRLLPWTTPLDPRVKDALMHVGWIVPPKRAAREVTF